MSNSYLDRRAREAIGQSGRRSESHTAARLGASQIPASGAAIQKGDMKVGRYLVEAKSTTGNSMSLRYEWLAKAAQEAVMVGAEPALSVSFVDRMGRPHRHGKWVLIEESTFQWLTRDG